MQDVFRSVYSDLKNEVEILAVHSKDRAGLNNFLKTNSYDFPILDDANYEGIGDENKYATGFYPANYMVDKWGYLYSTSSLGGNAAVNKFDLGTMTSTAGMKRIISGATKRAEV